MKNLAWCFLMCAPFISAQSFSLGVKGGGLFTEPAERLDQSRTYVVGPSLEVGFPHRVALEVNALYSRFGSSGLTSNVRSIRGHMVEFPVLGKYYFADRGEAVRPYASSGFAVRNIWFDRNGSGRDGRRFGSDSRIDSTEPGVGAVVGGGVAFRIGPLKMAPEVRYTRWGGFNYPATNPNQVQALLGITF